MMELTPVAYFYEYEEIPDAPQAVCKHCGQPIHLVERVKKWTLWSWFDDREDRSTRWIHEASGKEACKPLRAEPREETVEA